MVAPRTGCLRCPCSSTSNLPSCGRRRSTAEHTESILLELGYDWDEIIALKEAAVIP